MVEQSDGGVDEEVYVPLGSDLPLAGEGCAGMKISLISLWRSFYRRVIILLIPLVRLWRTFGWWTLVFIPILWVAVSMFIELKLNLRDAQTYELAAALAVIFGMPMLVASRKYQRSARTKPHDEVLGPLVTSAEEYCLLLRPFGSDGEITLLHKWDPWWVVPRALRSLTLEQAVALTAHESLGLKVYALVDQDRLLAPPGPVYLRSPHDRWQPVTQTLIRRAHSIVLILPPGQEMRRSFQWEIEQIVQHGLQCRVLIILPPYDRHSDTYSRALQQACVLIATLESFGSVADADPLRVGHWERLLAERTRKIKLCRVTKRVQVIKFRREANTEPFIVKCWDLKFTWWRTVTDVESYKLCLTPAFDLTKRELANLDFPTRYPWPPLS